jgi:hypothetical protein
MFSFHVCERIYGKAVYWYAAGPSGVLFSINDQSYGKVVSWYAAGPKGCFKFNDLAGITEYNLEKKLGYITGGGQHQEDAPAGPVAPVRPEP